MTRLLIGIWNGVRSVIGRIDVASHLSSIDRGLYRS